MLQQLQYHNAVLKHWMVHWMSLARHLSCSHTTQAIFNGAMAVQFVLDPLYKIFSCVIGEETKSIEKMLAQFKIKLKASTYGKDIKPLLTDVCTAVFGQASGLTEMLAVHIPSSKCAAQTKVEHLYLGPPVRSHSWHRLLCSFCAPRADNRCSGVLTLHGV